MLITSNLPSTNSSRLILKLLARLLPELYSTRSNCYYLAGLPYTSKKLVIVKFNFFGQMFLWQGSGKLEKAEILELTVEYLKALQGRLTEKQEQAVKKEGL